jgi:UDP-N-acetylmuramoyl-tripeptide--D-alanyl-D-alanine ligase
MNPLALSLLAREAGGVLSDPAAAEITATGFSQDTRKLQPGDVYVALAGENFDGHQFVAAAAAAGAVAALVQENHPVEAPAGFPLLQTADPLAALQRLAGWWRRQLNARVVGLTGSSGKTSTKEFLAAVLSQGGRVAATQGNLNNHIGLPLSILQATREDDFVVWEMGMNHPGEIAPLAALASPEMAVITNIGTAHIEFFPDRQGIAEEKAEIFRATAADGHCVFPGDDDFADTLAERAGGRAVPVWLDRGDLQVREIQHEKEGVRFVLTSDGEEAPVQLPVPGLHMVKNALLAAAVGRWAGLSLAQIATGLGETKLVGGRLEQKQIGGLTILDDSYNANPESVIAALGTLAVFPRNGRERRFAVLGRMGELGHYAGQGYERVGRAVPTGADVLIAVGPETAPLVAAARAENSVECHATDSVESAATLLKTLARPGDIVLLKGSRAARMERLLQHLQ